MTMKLKSYRGSFPTVLSFWKLVYSWLRKRAKETKTEKHKPAG